MSNRIKIIEVQNCLQCPFHIINDKGLICTNPNSLNKLIENNVNWEEESQLPNPPNWCSLEDKIHGGKN
jgi:hypothetical protein